MTERKLQDDLHLTDDEILDLVNNEASEEVRQWWEIHRQTCHECVEAVSMAQAVAAREAQMPLEKLSPTEERSVLSRFMNTIKANETPREQPKGIMIAVLEWIQDAWQVKNLLTPMAFRSRADVAEDQDEFRITNGDSGRATLHVSLGEDCAGKTVRFIGGAEELSAVLNNDGEATLVLPVGISTPLTVLLIEEQ